MKGPLSLCLPCVSLPTLAVGLAMWADLASDRSANMIQAVLISTCVWFDSLERCWHPVRMPVAGNGGKGKPEGWQIYYKAFKNNCPNLFACMQTLLNLKVNILKSTKSSAWSLCSHLAPNSEIFNSAHYLHYHHKRPRRLKRHWQDGGGGRNYRMHINFSSFILSHK